jgi:hypothetical protein
MVLPDKTIDLVYALFSSITLVSRLSPCLQQDNADQEIRKGVTQHKSVAATDSG